MGMVHDSHKPKPYAILFSKQGMIWTISFGVLFTIVVSALDALPLSTMWVFGAGTVFGFLSDPVCDWFVDWWKLERRLEQPHEYESIGADRGE